MEIGENFGGKSLWEIGISVKILVEKIDGKFSGILVEKIGGKIGEKYWWKNRWKNLCSITFSKL